MSYPGPAPPPLPDGMPKYAPFLPHPAIERRSNLAQVVAHVDARGDRERGESAYDSGEESVSGSDSGEIVVSDSDDDGPDVHVRSEHDHQAGQVTDGTVFPMPPPTAVMAPMSGKATVQRNSDKEAESVDKRASRILVRASRLTSSTETAVEDRATAKKDHQTSAPASIESGRKHREVKETAPAKQPVNIRGQLRTEGSLPTSGSVVSLRERAQSNGTVAASATVVNASHVRQVGSFSNASDWVPTAMPGGKSRIHNLPAWDGRSTNDVPRSTQNQYIKRDIDHTLRNLLSEDLFGRLLEDPLGKHRFRAFLSRTQCTSLAKLDMLTDLMTYSKTLQQLKDSSEALHDLYLAEDSPDHVQDMPSLVATELVEGLRAAFHLPVSTEAVQSHLLRSLYQTEFQRFIKKQLVEETKVRLGKLDLGDDKSGLGDCFCLTNPRLKENPIVLISDGFEALTGYPAQAVIGYNCRFLQSSGTSAESIQRVRDALNNGVGICEILLNYRKDGTPFWNLLNIIPLRDTEGRLAYFLAGQIEITGTLAHSKGLGFLLGGSGSVDDMSDVRDQLTVNGNEFSPTMSRHQRKKDSLGEANMFQQIQRNKMDGTADSEMLSVRRNSIRSDAARPIVRAASDAGNGYAASTAGSTKNSMIGKMTSKFRSRNTNASMPQRIGGAETILRRGTHNLEDQMAYFSDVYSKIIVFKRHKREVIFVTSELLTFLGYRTATNKETYNSSLIHSDLLSLICGSDNTETKAIRASVKEAVKAGKEFSIMACVKVRTTIRVGGAATRLFGGFSESTSGGDQDILGSGLAGSDRRYVTIHLTPLKDSKKGSFAFVGVIA